MPANEVAQYDEDAATTAIVESRTAHDLTAGAGNVVSTLPMETIEDRIAVFNLLANPKRLADNEGVVISLTGFLAQNVSFEGADGSMVDGVALYLVDSAGTSYITVSSGIFGRLQQMLDIFGDPRSWASPLQIAPVKKDIGRGRSVWTFEIVTTPKKK